MLVDVLLDMGAGHAAIRPAERALQIDPTSFTTHYQLARSLLTLKGLRARAVIAAQRAVEVDPHNADGHNLLGMCFAELGQSGRAEACYRQALAINPHHVFAQNNLAATALDLGRLGRASSLLRSALAGSPQETALHQNLDAVLIRLGLRIGGLLLLALLPLGVLATFPSLDWARAGTGLATLFLTVALAGLVARRLPRGLLTIRAVWGRNGWKTKVSVVCLGALVAGVAFFAFAPHEPVAEIAVAVGNVARVAGFLLLVGMAVGLFASKGDD